MTTGIAGEFVTIADAHGGGRPESHCSVDDGGVDGWRLRLPFAAIAEALRPRLRKARARRVTAGELVTMAERELADIGINRLEVDCLFDPGLMQEFRLRRRPRAGRQPVSAPAAD